MQGYINAIEYDESNDRVYVGGTFTSIGGVQASGVAYFENGNWHAIEGGVDGSVHALKLMGDDLYVGGLFERVGGKLVNHIARWDGSEWHALGSGTNGYGVVYALEWFDDKLYATGQYTHIGGVEMKGVAYWDGNNWHDSGLDSPLHARGLLVVADTLWAWGSAYANLQGHHHIASYLTDGEWTTLPELPDNSAFTALSFFRFNDHYHAVVFGDRLLRFTGTNWETVYTPISSLDLTGAFIFNDKMFAVTSTMGNNSEPAVVDIASGQVVGTMPSDYDNAEVITTRQIGEELWVGGMFRAVDGQLIASLARFDGVDWIPAGHVSGFGYYDVRFYSSGYAVEETNGIFGGRFLFAGNQFSPNIARWDGQD